MMISGKFGVRGCRYDWMSIYEKIRGMIDKGRSEESIKKTIVRESGCDASWVPKLFEWARDFPTSKTYKDARKNWGSAQLEEAVEKYLPNLVPKSEKKKSTKKAKTPKKQKTPKKETPKQEEVDPEKLWDKNLCAHEFENDICIHCGISFTKQTDIEKNLIPLVARS